MQLSNKKHYLNDLSILVLKDGFSFCTQEQTYAFPFQENLPSENDLQGFISSHALKIDNTRIYHFDTPSVLVPSPLFEEKTKEKYLTGITSLTPSEVVLSDDIISLLATAVYPQKKAIVGLLKGCFPKASSSHFAGALLPYLKETAAGNPKRHLYVHLRKGYFDLFLFQGSQLLMHNTFEQKNADDFLYYLFYVTEQFYLKPEQFELYFLGEFNRYTDYYRGAKDFHHNVEHLNLLPQNQDEKIPVPFFQNFFG